MSGEPTAASTAANRFSTSAHLVASQAKTRAPVSCEWCSKPLAAPASAAPSEPLPGEETGDEEGAYTGPLPVRMLKAAGGLLLGPIAAANGGLEDFFNTPGAPLGVTVWLASYVLRRARPPTDDRRS